MHSLFYNYNIFYVRGKLILLKIKIFVFFEYLKKKNIHIFKMFKAKINFGKVKKINPILKFIKNNISNGSKVYPSQVTIVEVGPR